MAAKPQLTIYDGVGARNKDLDASIAKFTSSGSWKRQRIVFIIPTADSIPAKVALAYWNLAFPPNNGSAKILAQGMEVGDAYSSAIEQVLAHPDLSQWEYICTAEHDNLPPADGIIRLLEHMESHPELACIGGLYWTKGPGGVPQIWGDIKDTPNSRPQPPDPNGGLVECYGTGMGFNLWRLAMFKDERIKRPWFRTLNGKDGQGIGTQDLVFWGEARKHGYRCAVACDVKVGHFDQNGDFGIKDFAW
jgi:hypothetical protein